MLQMQRTQTTDVIARYKDQRLRHQQAVSDFIESFETSDPSLMWDASQSKSRFERGGLLLVTDAPPSAVICRVTYPECRREYAAEREYLVDRRALGEVRVLKRYHAVSTSEARQP